MCLRLRLELRGRQWCDFGGQRASRLASSWQGAAVLHSLEATTGLPMDHMSFDLRSVVEASF